MRPKKNNNFSPLRYAGGKSRLGSLIASFLEKNGLNGTYVEPFCGGGSVALKLLLEGRVGKIIMNDVDRSIYAFWHSILSDTDAFCRRIEETKISVGNWKKERDVQKEKETANLFDLGFSTFFLNRTNVSGILKAGVIGGLAQEGNYKINCRFNKSALIEKIRLIATHRKKIKVLNMDAIDLLRTIKKRRDREKIAVFCDPPYYRKGKYLYERFYRPKDHQALFQEVTKCKELRWILSYDDVPEINILYKDIPEKQKLRLTVNHSARSARAGREVVIFGPSLASPFLV